MRFELLHGLAFVVVCLLYEAFLWPVGGLIGRDFVFLPTYPFCTPLFPCSAALVRSAEVMLDLYP